MKTKLFLAVAAAVLLLSTGCTEEVAWTGNTGRAYTMYGVLNPARDTQWVYVFPIEGTLKPGAETLLPATLTTLDRQTGQTDVWSQKLSQDPQGNPVHLYFHTLPPQYGHDVLITIEDELHGQASAEVRIPPVVNPVVVNRGSSVSTLNVIDFPDIDFVHSLQVMVRTVMVHDCTPTGCAFELNDIYVPITDGLQRAGNGWILNLNLSKVYTLVREKLSVVYDPRDLQQWGIQAAVFKVTAIIANEEWAPPGGTFDPDRLMFPEAMTNVENGFGFIGAGYRTSTSWTPERDALSRAGFKLP